MRTIGRKFRAGSVFTWITGALTHLKGRCRRGTQVRKRRPGSRTSVALKGVALLDQFRFVNFTSNAVKSKIV